MYHLFNKIRPFPVGRIAQPSLIVFIYVIFFFSHLCTFCVSDPNLLTPSIDLKKYYIFAYLQIKIMALFKITLMDMQFSRVRIQ